MVELHTSVSLRDKTTLRIGGSTAWYARPVSSNEVRDALLFSRERSLPLLVIGNGSNLLVSDSGWPGLTMAVTDRLTSIEWDGSEAVVQAGCPLDRLVKESVERGYAGLEELSGIPGTVGGAVIMNAGAYSSSVADTIVSADFIGIEDFVVSSATHGELGLGYRTSALKTMQVIVLSARFRLRPGDGNELKAKRREVLEKRREKQPLDLPNCGSVFKRPPGNYAGTLIEQAGLKGYRRGNVSISDKHANFIVNHGNGTAAEARHCIVHAQTKVYERSGVLLEPEVIFAGEFNEPLYVPSA